MKIKTLLGLFRVKQWVKNSFLFFPLIFSGELFRPGKLTNCLMAFFAFCLVSSGMYIFNDYMDRDKDRLHPKKSQRPMARLNITPVQVTLLIITLIGLGLLTCSQINTLLVITAILYIAISLIYNFVTKFIVLLDVIFVALGFHIRVWAGAMATDIVPSVWLQMCIFILALFLGFTKRRHEITTLGHTAGTHRGVLNHYTTYLLDQIIMICSTMAIVFYGLYTMSSDMVNRLGHSQMVYSVVFVIYGIFRYLYLSHVKKQGDDPGEILASDAPLLINVLLWILFICYLLYRT